MSEVHLVRPHAKYEQSYFEALSEMTSESDKSTWIFSANESSPDPKLDFAAYTKELCSRAVVEPPEGRVRDSFFWAVDECEQIVGRISVRHDLNKFLSKIGGHIGFIVRPSMRKRGFASQMLKLVLKKPICLSIGELLVTCDVSNIASEKCILKNGGVFDKLHEEEGVVAKKHFWIQA